MKKIIYFLFLSFLFSNFIFTIPKTEVYIIPIKGVIDLGLSAFVKRSLMEAKKNNAKLVIFEIDTFGGRVDAALDICSYIEEIKPIKSIAFIKERAWSGGALIAFACQDIFMSPTSSIGSVEPRVMAFSSQEEIRDEKIISAIRAQIKSLAEANNHPVNLALAMVDKDFEVKQVKIKDEVKILTTQEIDELKSSYSESDFKVIKTINPKGKLLNLTAYEAKEFGLAEDIVENTSKLLEYFKINGVLKTTLTWSENLVRFLTHPIISSLLLSLGLLGLFFEFRTPGWGISGTLGLVFLALFFWGYYLAGLANWTEILIFFLGLIFLFLEIFVIPGFGILGILGIIFIILGIFLSLLKYPISFPKFQIFSAFYILIYGIIFATIAVFLILKFFPKTKIFKNLILNSKEKKDEGFISSDSFGKYLGKRGKTLTILRPSGKADFEGEVLDVVSEGDFIDKDKKIFIVDIKGSNLIVREVNDQ